MKSDLLIEVKCSRRGKFTIKERDLSGLRPNQSCEGFLAALVTQNIQKGPHWIFIPANKMIPKAYKASDLSLLETDNYELFDQLNHQWGNVLMDDELIEKLVGMKNIDFRSMEWWHSLNLKTNDLPGNAIRKIKVNESLVSMRRQLTEKYKKYGSQREGFLHQCIIQFCLNKSGYETVSNSTGVPDLRVSVKFPFSKKDQDLRDLHDSQDK